MYMKDDRDAEDAIRALDRSAIHACAGNICKCLQISCMLTSAAHVQEGIWVQAP